MPDGGRRSLRSSGRRPARATSPHVGSRSAARPACRPLPPVTAPLPCRKNVLLVGTYVTSTHNHSVGEDLADRLRRSGWQVTATSHATGRLARLADMLATAWRARRDYDVAQVDVYSGKAFVWAEAVCLLLRRLAKPYVLTLHGGNLPRFARRHPGRVRRLLASAVVVTTPSRYLLEAMAPYRAGLRLFPNPVDLDDYRFRLRARAAPRLVWIRAFHRIYNPELAADVVARLRRDHPDIRLTMVGPDRDGSFARTRARAARLGVVDAIDFPGGVAHAEVPTWLDRGDVFVNTTNVDNTPVSILEAMACGLPVVSTNVGGIPYLLEAERDALLVPPDDAEAMSAAVGRVLRDPDLAARLSREGRCKTEAMSWGAMLPRWDATLMEATRG